jgi:hypothetical protein
VKSIEKPPVPFPYGFHPVGGRGHGPPGSCRLVLQSVSGQRDINRTVHGTEEIPPPPLKKSCLDRMRNSLARTVAQIRTGHWRSAVYLKRIRKMADDKCWFCQSSARMTRSHVLLHCPNGKLRVSRSEAWEGKDPGGVRVLLANPRWEQRLVKFLELSGVGRVMVDGTDEDGAYAARMDEWMAWETVEGAAPRGEG